MTAFQHDFPFDPTYGYDLEQLLQVGAPEEPDDFTEFWQETYAEARQIAPRLRTTAIESAAPERSVFLIEFDSWNGVRIGGWLSVPRDGHVERGVVMTHGYGGREAPSPEFPMENAAAIFPCLRGQGSRSLLPGVPSESKAHVLHGIAARETYIHRGCVADVWCAASALLELFPQLTTVQYIGSSFGGGIGAMALAWDARFDRAFLSVPSFGNHPLRVTLPCTGSGSAISEYYREHPAVLSTLQYFDAALHARHVALPVLCACALFDPAVPPPGQFAVYNALGGPRELFVRQAGHFTYAAEAQDNARIESAQQAWFAAGEL